MNECILWKRKHFNYQVLLFHTFVEALQKYSKFLYKNNNYTLYNELI